MWYPRDVYTVLFDPLPFSAHSITQLFAAAENTLILLVVLSSLPRLRFLPRVCMQRPYVFMALIYSVIFVFAFAALGNLGLITRERTLLLPFLFIVLAFPVAIRERLPTRGSGEGHRAAPSRRVRGCARPTEPRIPWMPPSPRPP